MINPITVEEKKTISILGCGWYGLELAKALVEQGYSVKGSSTTQKKLELLHKEHITPFLVSFKKDEENYDPLFFKNKLLLICIPPKRNSGEQADFHHKIERIIYAAKQNGVQQVIFISSTAVYGDTNSEVTELTAPQPETASGKAMLDAENLLLRQTDFTTTIIRFAGLIGPERHPGKFFAGKTDVPNGKAPVNLIHLNDCIGLSLALIRNKAFGHIINACSPDHPSKQAFYSSAASNAQLPVPLFKNELLQWKLVSSVQSHLLNYNYLITNWIKWFDKDR